MVNFESDIEISCEEIYIIECGYLCNKSIG